jgi:hypothetical protein
LLWKDRRLFHKSPLRIGKVLVGHRVDNPDAINKRGRGLRRGRGCRQRRYRGYLGR